MRAWSASTRAQDTPQDIAVLVKAVTIEPCIGSCGDADALRDNAPDRNALALPPIDRLLEIIRPQSSSSDDDPAGHPRRDHLERVRDASKLNAARARGNNDGVGRADRRLHEPLIS